MSMESEAAYNTSAQIYVINTCKCNFGANIIYD